MEQEIEFITWPKIKHIKIFFDNVFYRNNHLHREIELCILLDGEAIFRCAKNDILVKKGDVVFMPSNAAHSIQETKAPMMGLFIQLSTHFLREYFPFLNDAEFQPALLSDYLNIENRKKLIKNALKAAESYFFEPKLYQYSVLSEICQIVQYTFQDMPYEIISKSEMDRKKRAAKRIGRVMAYIDEHIADQLRLTQIAEEYGMTPTHLSHIFSKELGVSFQDYVNTRRLEEAVRIMALNPNVPMIDISIEAGFSDQKYMTKMFLKTFGCTPKVFASRKDISSIVTTSTSPLEHIYGEKDSLPLIEKYQKEFA